MFNRQFSSMSSIHEQDLSESKICRDKISKSCQNFCEQKKSTFCQNCNFRLDAENKYFFPNRKTSVLIFFETDGKMFRKRC